MVNRCLAEQWRVKLLCVELLHQTRFATSSVVPVNNAFFGGAIELADSSAYGSFRVLCAYTGAGYRLAGLRYLRLHERFNTAIMRAALLFLAHALLCRCIVRHVSINPPRFVCLFLRLPYKCRHSCRTKCS